MKSVKAGGGFPAIWYTVRKARDAGRGPFGLRTVRGVISMYSALRSRNACKTCALGMGGRQGGMVNERGRFPEVCKKSVQAMAADLQGGLPPHFFDPRHGGFDFEHLKRLTPRELELSGRLTRPLYAGPGDASYREIPWDDAIELVAERMVAADPDRSFFYFSGRSSNEAGFLLQLVARLYGTNNVNNCSYYCHQASGVGLSSVTGSGTATVVLEDLDHADLVFLVGGNPASNHPRLMRTLVDLRRRGGRVIVINPLHETGLVRFKVPSDPVSLLFGSQIADQYIKPHIGGDIALLTGIAKRVLERDGADLDFLSQACDGWPELRERLEALAWSEIVEGCGVSQAEIDEITTMYLESKRTIFAWAMGITHHEHGVQNVQAIANLAMMRGMLGKPGVGLLPLRGHSNVQGIGSMGVVPQLKEAVLERLESEFDVTMPRTPGLDTMACMERANEGGIDFSWLLGGNLYGSNPDAAFASSALGRIGFSVQLSTTLNTGHMHGRAREQLILPVLARDEESQSTTQESMFNFVRLSEGGKARHSGPRSEVSVISSIAKRVLGTDPVDFSLMEDHGTIREAIGRIIPGYQAIGTISKGGREFQIDGRTFHEPRFATSSGRAQLHVVDLPRLDLAPDELRLMTVRSEGQFNTVVYEEHDLYRGQERRDVILMNELDMQRFGLALNDRVTVSSATGEMHSILVRSYDIREGNACMYFPESNVLVPRAVDPKSATPSFKSVRIRVRRERKLPVMG